MSSDPRYDSVNGRVRTPDHHADRAAAHAHGAAVVGQAFERAMAEAGGSASTWQVLVLVRAQKWGTQARDGRGDGHHRRDPDPPPEHRSRTAASCAAGASADNRRVQHVELTDAGAELFDRLRVVAQAHDRRLRAGLSEDDVARLGELLDRLQAGVTDAVVH